MLPKMQLRRGLRICERNNSVDTTVSEEREEGGAPGIRAETPLQHMLKTVVRLVVPCSPWRLMEEQISNCSL